MKKLVMAIVKKCSREDSKSGHNWCVYKHPKDSDTPYDTQPKGWPKHYKTKEDAKHGVKMMKTFAELQIALVKKGRIDLVRKITSGILDVNYDRNPVMPNPRNKSLLEGPGLAPGRGLGPRRRYYNRVKTNPMEAFLPPRTFTWSVEHNGGKNLILAKDRNSSKVKSVLMIISNKGDKFTVIALKRGNGFNVQHFLNDFNNKKQKEVIDDTIELAKKNNYLKYVKENLSAKEFVNLVVKKEGYIAIEYLEKTFPILKPYLSIEDNENNEDISKQNFKKIGNFKVAFEDDVKQKYIDIVENFITKASDILQKAGLGKLLYGRVFVVDKLIGKRIADYISSIDTIRISKKVTTKYDFIKPFIHELGHRINYKFADDWAIRDKFNSLSKGKIKAGDTVEYKARKKDGSIAKYSFVIDKIKGSIIFVHEADNPEKTYNLPKKSEKFLFVKKSKTGSEEEWFPSVYSKKNYKEWFAEIFANGILENNKLYTDFVKSVLK